jgi:hypothetical protein
MMHRLSRQCFQGQTQRISYFLPGTFKFAQFLGVDYVDGRITRMTIYDCHAGRETLEQRV